MKKNKKSETNEPEKNLKFYYNRKEREEKLHITRTEIKGSRYFSTGRGKITLILITLVVISFVWMSKNVLKRSSYVNYLKNDDLTFKIYAFQIKNTNNISIDVFIKNNSDEEQIVRFEKIYIEIIDKKSDKTILTHTHLEKFALILGPRKTETFQYVYRNIKEKGEYKVEAIFIDSTMYRYSVEMNVDIKS